MTLVRYMRYSESRLYFPQPAAQDSVSPRIEHGLDEKLKICGVARHQRQGVDLRGLGNERIHCLDWSTARLVARRQSPPFILVLALARPCLSPAVLRAGAAPRSRRTPARS